MQRQKRWQPGLWVIVILGMMWMQVGECQAPDFEWCETVQLPSDVPFIFPQTSWWNEYYMFNASQDMTVTFKVYTQMPSSEHMRAYVGTNVCPVFTEWASMPNDFGNQTASVTVAMSAQSFYVLFAHMSGSNYSIVVCEGDTCPEICPNDCTSGLNGICDLYNGTCNCVNGFVGDDCSQVPLPPPPPHVHKYPFGSETLFLIVVAGIPVILAVAIGTIAIVFLASRKRKEQAKKTHKQPLLYAHNYGTASAPPVAHHHHAPNSPVSPTFPIPHGSPDSLSPPLSSSHRGSNISYSP